MTQNLRTALDIAQAKTSAKSHDDGISSPAKIEITINDGKGIKKDPKKLHYTFLIFVNPGSGDSKAALLVRLDVEKMIFSTFNPKDADVEVHIYNLRDSVNRAKGLTTLKALEELGESHIRVIVGGGDGSIMWAVQEMISAEVSFEKCAIGTIPFGTGNDFSRVLGWGPTEPKVLIGPHLNNLKGMITKWVDAQVEDFDIWEITIETHENGGLKQIQKSTGKRFQKKFMSVTDLETGKEVPINSFKKLMCNYFSFGIESRIGYGFEKGRTRSRLGNKIVYAWEGFKKFFKKTPKVNDIVENLQTLRIGPNGEEIPIREMKLDEPENADDDFLIYPKVGLEEAKTDKKIFKNVSIIKGNPSVFLCLNIPSFMGGASDPWKSSRGKVGAHDDKIDTLEDFGDQRFGDGKIEILTFAGPMSLATERILKGQGRRIGQAKGPFVINFKKSENANKPLHTYMQVDGEFYDVVAPKRVKISLCPKIPNGKIKVMLNSSTRK
jgi:diacylglycerol kinase (ATP)